MQTFLLHGLWHKNCENTSKQMLQLSQWRFFFLCHPSVCHLLCSIQHSVWVSSKVSSESSWISGFLVWNCNLRFSCLKLQMKELEKCKLPTSLTDLLLKDRWVRAHLQIQMENVKKKKFQNKCVFGSSPFATKTKN